ncbi:chemotaxis protein CheW [Chroococcidiopsis sp. TS-821]|uniref:chemotaxis protein CheW n=1 Tax=Chroococcidiopsis sp. TS-821 TaxID=1378066 RepID=UPI000CEE0B92|nr:chemotaxis protein CheW [Chroococcidiopsis sp. TS-821]PPS45104.1 hypothetical protein B1A85_02190 [Chroococcidiopsis sp. TS-821]
MQSTSKFVVFQIANYLLALPAHSIVKVIYTPLSEKNIHTGLVHTAKYTITLLNLQEKLISDRNSQDTYNFIIITQSKIKELIAISVKEPPDFLELADENIRALPHSYPRKTLLQLSANIGVLAKANITTVFILDVDKIQHSFAEIDNQELA